VKAVELGRIGEEYAVSYLQQAGLRVATRNFHSAFGEIDIIAENEQYIVFVEVKTRAQNCLGAPADAVGRQKQRRIIKTAACYLLEHPCELQPRFDVIEILTASDGKVISCNHFKNAFWAQSGADVFCL